MSPVNDPQLRVKLVMWRMVVLVSRVEGVIKPRSSFKLLRLRHRSLGGILKEKKVGKVGAWLLNPYDFSGLCCLAPD